MRRLALLTATMATLLAAGHPARADGPATAPGAAASPTVDWQPTVVGAFEAAKKEGKPLFIALNSEHVLGKTGLEPAALELREHTYHDPAVVAKSRAFVCTMVKPDGSSADYTELRVRLGIQGDMVSPQHVFVHADGTLISRKEYWKYGTGQGSVDALIALMDAALVAHRAKVGMDTPGGTGTPTGTPEEQRAAWIRERVEKIRGGASDHAARDVAVVELVHGDKKGDCITPLCALLFDPKKDPDTAVAILRALGKPGLEAAVSPTAQMLDDTTDAVRSNAAVTLEYIGSALGVEPLTKRLSKEQDEFTHNNICRALGHCGVKQEAVRKLLLREFEKAKNNKVSVGPAIGLSYFEGDADAARGIEKIMGPGVDWQKRAYGLYALTQIGDPKSADFVSEKVLKTEKNQAALPFLNAVVAVLAGTDADGSSRRTMNKGIESALGTMGDIGGPARKDRDQSEFTPNGEFTPSRGRGR